MPFALADRDDAAMRHFADLMFELDRRVVDAEAMMQAVFYVPQNAFADRGRNVGNRDVAGECARLRSDAPAVQIVNVIHSLNRANFALH